VLLPSSKLPSFPVPRFRLDTVRLSAIPLLSGTAVVRVQLLPAPPTTPRHDAAQTERTSTHHPPTARLRKQLTKHRESGFPQRDSGPWILRKTSRFRTSAYGSMAVSTLLTTVCRLPHSRCPALTETGHAGAMLQARQLGNELFVGVHSDESIMENKGPTVMRLDERCAPSLPLPTNFLD